MKLYLSSNGIPSPSQLEQLVGKPLSGARIALIENAKDYYSDKLRTFKIQQGVQQLESLGMEVVTVDLRNYHDKAELKSFLAGFDIVWGYGGNTFCLRYEMARSGFDEVIRELLADGIVYGGESAGAIVAGKTMRGIEKADIPEAAEEIIWNGMSLINKIIMPHADSLFYKDAVEYMKELYGENPDYIEINDLQALVVNGDDIKVVDGDITI